MRKNPLPIDSVLPNLLSALEHNSCVVLRAPTGAGKTTRVPPAILEAGLAGTGQIVVLQPRRIAARATSRRMAFERGSRLGEEIGYQVRFERQAGPLTRILVVTEGILLRQLQEDAFLQRASVVVFDEFHERNLESELALGMIRQVQQSVRPELRVVVMSATLAAEPIAAYLGGCPIVESQGRLHPIEIRHSPPANRQTTVESAARGIGEALNLTAGDILVFLPGVHEIRQTARQLEGLAQAHRLEVFELYGDLPAERQDAVLAPCERRKIVLATNVAETSLTIEGITAVVDTGLARVLTYDPQVGLDKLELVSISQAAANQRAGRAGRTAPGVCIRLWSEASQRIRPEFETPEIRRLDLAGPLLTLAAWIEPDPSSFPWFERPSPASLEQGRSLLRRLGAIDENGITSLGRQMAGMPVSPRLARLLLAGCEFGVPEQAALAAALLAERSPFARAPGGAHAPRAARHASSSDLFDRLLALEEFERGERTGPLHEGLNVSAARFVLRARDQLLRLLPPAKRASAEAAETALARALLAAFPDRLARRREPGSRRGLLVGGRGVRLAPESAVAESELFLCLEIDGAAPEALVRLASAVEREWLPAELLTTACEVSFDEAQERVSARRRVAWDGLVIEDAPANLPDDEQTSAVLARAAAERFERVFPQDDGAAAGFVARVRSLSVWMPELKLPPLDDPQLKSLLPALCRGRRSFRELKTAPWLEFIQGLFSYAQLQTIEREAPERLAVPSGNRHALAYEAGRPPVLAVRIQELFGLLETPRVAAGRVPVLLHLLAPNMRPQQVTDDLASFWKNTYQQVRKDLRGRYPKHAWPEDPYTAVPQSRPRRKA